MPNTPTRARGAGREAGAAGRGAGSLTVMTTSGSALWRRAYSRAGPLEVEVVDVLLVEPGGWAEDDLAVGADRVLAEPAGLELLALLAGDAAGHERRGGLAGEEADVLRDPQLELRHRAVLDELAHLVRRAQPGELDLALLGRARQVAGGGRDADGGRGDDALQVGIGLDEPLGLLEGLLVVVVAVGDLHELDVLVGGLLQLLLHDLDPGVLVRRVGRRGQDRYLALAADLLGDELDLALADQLRGGLVDEHRAGVGRHVGVHADDLDPSLRGLLERRGDGVRVVAGADDRVRLLLGDRVDDGHLRGRAGVRRTLDAIAAAELLQRLLHAGVLRLLVGIAELLRDGDRLEALLDRGVGIRLGGRRAGTRARAGRAAARGGRLVVLGRAAGGEDERRQQQRQRRHGHAEHPRHPGLGHAGPSCWWCACRRRASPTRRAMFGPRTAPTS